MAKGNLFCAFAAHIFIFYGLMAKHIHGQRIQPMSLCSAGIQHIGQAHSVIYRRQRNTAILGIGQHMAIIFQIMPDFQHRRIMKERCQHGQCRVKRDLFRDRRRVCIFR